MAKHFPHQMSKKNPHFQIDIFVIGCEKHSRRNAFSPKQLDLIAFSIFPLDSTNCCGSTSYCILER